MTAIDNTAEFAATTPPAFAPTPPPSAPTPPAPGVARRRGAVSMIIGAVLIGSGFLTAASGGALLAVFGSGEVLSTGQHIVSTPTSAFVADLGRIDDISGWEFLTGSPTLHINAENVSDADVFVGVGPTDDVERYLGDVSVERVTDLDLLPFDLATVRHNGSAQAEPPGGQDFWIASNESQNSQGLAWAIEDGSYEIVLMNADGTDGVISDTVFGVSLPTSMGLWLAVMGVGVLSMIGGAVLLVIGSRRTRAS